MSPSEDGRRDLYIARGSAPGTFVVRPVDDAPPVIQPASLSVEQLSANEEFYRRFRTAFAADVQVTLVDGPLPDGVLARLYRAKGLTREPAILVSRQELSIELLFAARHALAGDIARRPDGSPDDVLVLTSEFVVIQPDGTTRRMEVMRRAEERSPSDSVTSMQARIEEAEPTVFEGMTVRTLKFSQLVH